VTNAFIALAHGMTTICRACETDVEVAAAVPAIHLEGPYISAEDGREVPIHGNTFAGRIGMSFAGCRTRQAAASVW